MKTKAFLPKKTMSHFAALVIGDYPEDLLAPYSECDEDYFTEHDITEETLADFKRYKGIIDGVEYDFPHFAEKWECATIAENLNDHLRFRAERKRHNYTDKDGVCKVYAYYNDNAKYDYYSNARNSFSRWDYSSFIFKDKNFDPGLDDIRMCDVDFDAMLLSIDEERGREYDEVIKLFGGSIPEYKTWTSLLDSVEEKYSELQSIIKDSETTEEKRKEAIDERDKLLSDLREFYWNQDAIKSFDEKRKGNEILDHGNILDEFYGKTREEYINEGCLPFYAIVTEDGWHERAKMGWWGTEYDKKMSLSDWRNYQINLLKEITEKNPDTCVDLYDCHI